jgi:hypothetical protein
LIPAEGRSALMLFCHGNAGNISHRLDNIRRLHDRGLGSSSSTTEGTAAAAVVSPSRASTSMQRLLMKFPTRGRSVMALSSSFSGGLWAALLRCTWDRFGHVAG